MTGAPWNALKQNGTGQVHKPFAEWQKRTKKATAILAVSFILTSSMGSMASAVCIAMLSAAGNREKANRQIRQRRPPGHFNRAILATVRPLLQGYALFRPARSYKWARSCSWAHCWACRLRGRRWDVYTATRRQPCRWRQGNESRRRPTPASTLCRCRLRTGRLITFPRRRHYCICFCEPAKTPGVRDCCCRYSDQHRARRQPEQAQQAGWKRRRPALPLSTEAA